MINGQTLIDFANKHGYIFPPYRDPDLWAQEINAAGGQCACGFTCPCQQAVDDIANAVGPKDERCRCSLFVTPAYGDEWKKEWEKYIRKNKQIKSQQPKEEPEEQWEIQTPEIKSITDVLAEAANLIGEGKPEDAYDLLIAEKEKHPKCDACQGYLDEMAARANLQMAVCRIDEERCTMDGENTIGRATELIEFYTEVDKSMINDAGPAPAPELENVNAKVPYSEHHNCVSKRMQEMKEQIPNQHERLVEATRTCAMKKQSE